MNHCERCSTGTKPHIVAALREAGSGHLNLSRETLLAVATRLHVGYHYAVKVQSKARRLGCLRAREPMPPPPRPRAWTLPPIGAVYVRTM